MVYWKEHCIGMTTLTLVDEAKKLDHIGGTFGSKGKPTPFLCLILKILQIQPEKGIVVEFIRNEYFKYVRVLGAFYMRLTGGDIDVYRYLEPLYNDSRKLRRKLADGGFALTRVDEVVEELLTIEYCCDIALPRMKKRESMERLDLLEPRISALEYQGYTKEELLNEDNDISSSCMRSRRRRRSRSRNPSRSKNHNNHDDEDGDSRKRRHNESGTYDEQIKIKERKRDDGDGTNYSDPEIAAANRVRASLGFSPPTCRGSLVMDSKFWAFLMDGLIFPTKFSPNRRTGLSWIEALRL